MNTDSKQLFALKQERADLVKEGAALFAQAEKDARALNDDEKARDDAIHARLEAIGPEIDRHVRNQERQRALSGQAPAVLKLQRGEDPEGAYAHFFRTGESISGLTERDGREIALSVPIPSIAETKQRGYWSAVVDSTMNITTAADGANIVPTGLVPNVITRRNEADLTLRLGLLNVPGQGTTVNYPVEAADPEVFAATSEQGDAHSNNYERDSGVTDLKAFTLAKKSRKVELTEELLTDTPVNLNSYIGDRIGRQIALTHNTMLLTEVTSNGTALKTFASASAIAAGELESLLGNDALGYYIVDGSRPSWIMRPSTNWAIRALTGNFRQYASETTDTNQSMGSQPLLGYPVAFSQVPAVPAASAKSVYFGAWDFVGYREDPALRFIMDPYSVDGLVILKYSFRAVYGVLQAAAVGYGKHPSA